MPMIDIVASEGTFPESSEAALLERATQALLKAERTASVPISVANTGAYLHLLKPAHVAAGGKPARVVRVQILTPVGSLKQDQRAEVTSAITGIVGELASDKAITQRTWVLFHEAVEGGWGIAGKAYTNADIHAAVAAGLKK